ncbi:MAG: hypothetical protein ABSE72_08045, partial [Bacteroidales bacterium]
MKDEKLQMIFEVIKEHTKAKNIVINKEELKSGYIDHQSAETSMEAFESKQTLFEFFGDFEINLFSVGKPFEYFQEFLCLFSDRYFAFLGLAGYAMTVG